MKIGFTGTQKGMTAEQKKTFRRLLKQLNPTEFHNGDCLGADLESYLLILIYDAQTKKRVKIVIHPPDKPDKRAFIRFYDEIREPKPYLERDEVIAAECDVLIATPKEFKEEVRSGTWATVRYARKAYKKVYIIWPNGNYNGEKNISR
jgi:hypothetical protein